MDKSKSFERLKNLDLSRDEINRLGEALKKDEFRNLLIDYVKEIQDPENKKKYEEEITQLEKERGNDITFLHPIPCYVIKTTVNGNKKCFINICGNDLVNKPSSTPSEKDGSRGLDWLLPHSLSPPSEDVDNKGEHCQVFDVLFHPDTLHLAHKNNAFKNMINTTACKAIESNFDVKLDKNNLKFPKIKYKGIARASVIRKPSAEGPVERSPEEKEFYDKLYAQADESINDYKFPKKSNRKSKNETFNEDSVYTTPKYVVKHRKHIEMEEFTENKESKLTSTIPRELVVEINLPLLKSANEITLDVTEKTVQLISEKPAKYKMNLSLPYQVDKDRGNAKFDKDMKILIITLPVRRISNNFCNNIKDFQREDSGVESDHGSPVSEEENSESPEPDEETYLTKFLDENIEYSIPEFSSHIFDNVIAFTLNVKNVDVESVAKLIDQNSVHVKFMSLSSSFFPSHYSFFVNLPVESISKELITVEVWDNNVILQIPFECSSELSYYSYGLGLNKNELLKKYIEEPRIINALHEENLSSKETETTEKIVTESKSLNIQKTNELDNLERDSSVKDVISGSYYESSGDELSCSFSPRRSRGILKTARKSFSRSISESSLDDCIGSLEYEGADPAIPEDNEPGTEMSTSLKKTVRFNDVVSKQLYRFNSSILGQRKKNQRKAQKKKKALERRHSESEASEVDDKRESDQKTNSDSDLFGKKSNSEEKTGKRDENIFELDM